jgi:hypothetical protein
MRSRTLPAVLLAAALALGLVAGGCGSDTNETSVKEGEPVELAGVSYNVSISRFLNPADPEDRAYLEGQKPLPNDQQWFGVFMQVHNDGDTAQAVPSDFVVRDTQGNKFEPVPSDSVFALDLGGEIGPGADLPEPETAAAGGPIEGAMVLFLIDEGTIENRPLTLDIPSSSGEVGEVELDI